MAAERRGEEGYREVHRWRHKKALAAIPKDERHPRAAWPRSIELGKEAFPLDSAIDAGQAELDRFHRAMYSTPDHTKPRPVPTASL